MFSFVKCLLHVIVWAGRDFSYLSRQTLGPNGCRVPLPEAMRPRRVHHPRHLTPRLKKEYMHLYERTRPRTRYTHAHAGTRSPISNTYCFSTATMIRERATRLRYTYIARLVEMKLAAIAWRECYSTETCWDINAIIICCIGMHCVV